MAKVSSAAILNFIDRLEKGGVCMHGFELRVQGEIRAEGYYAPFRKGEMHRMYSISKTMTALAVGILAGEGKISLEDRICDYFRDKLAESPDPRVLRLTIRDMLRMATCHKKTTYREGIDYNWDESFFTVKPTHEPGTMFNYDTSCSQVLCAMCQRVTGRNLLEFLQERVFDPIGATDSKKWLTDPSGVPQGGTGLMMSLRDLGKVAQLVADGGRGIVPADFIAQMTRRQIVNEAPSIPEEANGYGYQVWMTRNGWAMCGMGGQMAVCCPEKEILLCAIADNRLDGLGIQKMYSAFYEEIVAREGEAEWPGDAQRLEERLGSLKMISVPHVGGELSKEKRVYTVEDNDAGLQRMELEGHTLRVVWEDDMQEFRWDKLGENTLGQWTGTDYPTITSAGLTADGALHVRCQLIHHAPCGLEMFLHEKQETLSVRMRKSNDPATRRYEGIFWGVKA